jgi:hypothetical protein
VARPIRLPRGQLNTARHIRTTIHLSIKRNLQASRHSFAAPRSNQFQRLLNFFASWEKTFPLPSA